MSMLKTGIIISDKMNQTATVQVERIFTHPIYKKQYRINKNIKANNPDNQYKHGDRVVIKQTRPMSKQKHWEIIKKVGPSKENK